MLTPEQTETLLRNPATLIVLDGFDAQSPGLRGPFRCVGDCVSEHEAYAAAYVDSLCVRDGDLGLWFMPCRPEGDQYAAKWLLADDAQRLWLACKFFAVRYRPDYHFAIGRVVAIVRGEPGTFDDGVSERMRMEITALRRSPPMREDVRVFQTDLTDRQAIVDELNRRH